MKIVTANFVDISNNNSAQSHYLFNSDQLIKEDRTDIRWILLLNITEVLWFKHCIFCDPIGVKQFMAPYDTSHPGLQRIMNIYNVINVTNAGFHVKGIVQK